MTGKQDFRSLTRLFGLCYTRRQKGRFCGIANAANMHQVVCMSVTMTAGAAKPIEGRFPSWLSEMAEDWIRAVRGFSAWEHEQVILRDPDEQTWAAYREELKWLLRAGQMLQALVRDPESHDRKLALRLDGCLAQLDLTWEMTAVRVSDEEANRLLKETFPDERDFIDSLNRPR